MGIVKYIEVSGLLNKGISKSMENEAKEQKGRFLGMLMTTLDAMLLGNMIEEISELVKEELELVRIFNVTSAFS